MTRNAFAGTWTYRSFYNKPEPVKSFDEIKLAQAQLLLIESGVDWLTGRLTFGDGAAYIEMTGVSTLVEGRLHLRMRGTGVDGTPTAGWV